MRHLAEHERQGEVEGGGVAAVGSRSRVHEHHPPVARYRAHGGHGAVLALGQTQHRREVLDRVEGVEGGGR